MQLNIDSNEIFIIKNSPLFHTIPEESLKYILISIEAQKAYYPKGGVILREGENINNLGIILSGGAKAIKAEPSGKSLLISSLTPGKVFGDVLSLSGKQKSPVSIIALEDTQALIVPVEKIIKKAAAQYDSDDRLLNNLLNLISTKYFELLERINCLIRPSLREKILLYLYNQAGSDGSSFTIALDRQGLAEYLNADRSALSRELSKMKADGLIDYYRNSFRLLRL